MKETKTDMAMEFARNMSELRNQIRQFVQNRIKDNDINLTYEMFEVLFHLWQKDNINQQELSNLTFRDKSSTTYILNNLGNRALIIRADDGKDRRNKRIQLTQKGKDLQEQLQPVMTELCEVIAESSGSKALQESIVLINNMKVNLVKMINP